MEAELNLSELRTTARTPREPLTDCELSISGTELAKLSWVDRTTRPDFIYDAAAAAQVFPKEEITTESKNIKLRKEKQTLRKEEGVGFYAL